MNPILYADNETYEKILAWGDNNRDEWYHPLSRSDLTRGFNTLKAGDYIDFILDGVSSKVQVVSSISSSVYGKLKHVRGEFSLCSMKVSVVLCVRRV